MVSPLGQTTKHHRQQIFENSFVKINLSIIIHRMKTTLWVIALGSPRYMLSL